MGTRIGIVMAACALGFLTACEESGGRAEGSGGADGISQSDVGGNKGDSAAEPGPDAEPGASDTDGAEDGAVAPADTAASDGTEPEPDVPTFPPAPAMLGGDRPAAYVLPADYTPTKAWPVIVVLHGYSATGLVQDAYLGISSHGTGEGFITLIPEGTVNSQGLQFWNASPACCDKDGSGVDDVGYLMGLLDEAERYFHIDSTRIGLFGHSNGGFMAYRLACDRSDRITGIISLAGSSLPSDAACNAEHPVTVLQVHGTLDDTVKYGGGVLYPGALEAATLWAAHDGCTEGPTAGEPIDLIPKLEGAETERSMWSGCEGGSAVELWTLVGEGHIPFFTTEFSRLAVRFLLDHPRR